MVGIPGKSKGCHTCRRRKLGCDLTKPSCWKCTNSGRICEGYERGAVFLNRTEKGLQKRRRLDEARLRGNGRVARSVPVEIGEDKKLHKSKSSISPVQSFQTLQSPSAMKQRCQGVFMDRFLPSDLGKAGNIGLWLREAVSLDESVQGKALEMSLRALFVTRVGRVMQNQDLIIEGKMAYSGALQELQKALWSKELVVKDETLATCHALAIYELYESTTNSIRGHDNHILGILRLIQHRGSNVVHSRLGDALMRETYYPSMIYSIQYRRASPMEGFVLQSESWSQHDISRQRLHSLGLSLGALIEDIDRFRSAMSNVGVLCEILGRCSKLDDELERWYDDFQKMSSLLLYWKNSADFNDPASTEIEFPSLAVAHQMLDFWAL